MIVKIETPNIVTSEAATGRGTLISTHEGNPIHGVTKATVHFEPNKVVTAELVIHAAVKTSAMATFVMRDPLAGQYKAIRRIEFEDETIFESEPELCEICRAPATKILWTLLRMSPEIDRDGGLNARFMKDRQHHLCAKCESFQ